MNEYLIAFFITVIFGILCFLYQRQKSLEEALVILNKFTHTSILDAVDITFNLIKEENIKLREEIQKLKEQK